MKHPVTAVFPGSFDPITLGHENMILRAARLFDYLIVAVAAAHHKQTMFSLKERTDMASIAFAKVPNIKVYSFSTLMSEFIKEHQAHVMIRGLRGSIDFDYERQLAGMNRSLMPNVETFFMSPSADLQHICSTYVREIARLNGPVAQFVNPHVHQQLQNKITT